MPEEPTQQESSEQIGGDDEKTRIQEIDPEREPEYVGAHSALGSPSCQNVQGEYVEDLEQCGAEATHTVVMYYRGSLSEVAMCDDCGEPEDVGLADREWSGEVVESAAE